VAAIREMRRDVQAITSIVVTVKPGRVQFRKAIDLSPRSSRTRIALADREVP
jgi:hypothetical protein